jgi:hypothetical protein
VDDLVDSLSLVGCWFSCNGSDSAGLVVGSFFRCGAMASQFACWSFFLLLLAVVATATVRLLAVSSSDAA